MPTVKVRDIEMYYRVHGRPDGEPLILLHAFTETGVMFDPYLVELGQEYRLYIPDWRGHGRTSNPKGEIRHEDLALDTAVFAKAIGLERAHFCGISSGAMLLTFLVLQEPMLVHSLTYAASTYTFDQRVQSAARKAAGSVSSRWIESLKVKHGQIHGEAYAHEIVERWLESVLRPDELPFTPADLRPINCPTLIVHGDRDLFFPVDVPLAMYEAIPNAELLILPDCGHAFGSESRALFAGALLQFLARHPLP